MVGVALPFAKSSLHGVRTRALCVLSLHWQVFSSKSYFYLHQCGMHGGCLGMTESLQFLEHLLSIDWTQ